MSSAFVTPPPAKIGCITWKIPVHFYHPIKQAWIARPAPALNIEPDSSASASASSSSPTTQSSSSSSSSSPATPNPLKIMTYNIWFSNWRSKSRTNKLCSTIQQHSPDIISLQEVTEKVLEYILQNEYIRQTYQISSIDITYIGSYGVVMLVKPFVSSFTMYKLKSRMGRSVLVAHCPTRTQATQLYGVSTLKSFQQDAQHALSFVPHVTLASTVHLESLEPNRPARIQQLQQCLEILDAQEQQCAPHQVVKTLMGDFNFGENYPENKFIPAHCQDLWRTLHLDAKQHPGYTMPASDGYQPWRPDRILVHKTPLIVPQHINIIGDQPYDVEEAKALMKSSNQADQADIYQPWSVQDQNVLTISDHYGLFSTLQWQVPSQDSSEDDLGDDVAASSSSASIASSTPVPASSTVSDTSTATTSSSSSGSESTCVIC